MSENFDSKGKVYKKTLDSAGNLIYENADGIIKPKNNVIYGEYKQTNILSKHILECAKYDMTNTRVDKKCEKCPCNTQIIIRNGSNTFYICEICNNYIQV